MAGYSIEWSIIHINRNRYIYNLILDEISAELIKELRNLVLYFPWPKQLLNLDIIVIWCRLNEVTTFLRRGRVILLATTHQVMTIFLINGKKLRNFWNFRVLDLKYYLANWTLQEVSYKKQTHITGHTISLWYSQTYKMY